MVALTSTIPRPVGAIAPTTAKPLLRRPTLVRKRDDDVDAPPSSPEKRAKVAFSSEVEVRAVDEWQHAPELVQEEVRRAFEKRGWGDRSSYDKIKDVFASRKDNKDAPSSTTLRNYTMALLANVSSLNKSSSDLVDAVLHSEWLGRQEDYVYLYVRMLASLVSAQGMFLGDALRMLVENLTASKLYTHKGDCGIAHRNFRSTFKWPASRPAESISISDLCSRPQSLAIPTSAHSVSQPGPIVSPHQYLPSSDRLTTSAHYLRTQPT